MDLCSRPIHAPVAANTCTLLARTGFDRKSTSVPAESATMARQDAVGMVVGGIGMSACCVLAALSIPRVKAFWGSFAAWMTWMAIGLGLYWAMFVGAR